MPRRADITIAQTTGILQHNGAGVQYVVQANNGDLYYFYVDTGSDLAFKKSTDGGLTWSAPTIVFAGTITNFAVWFDRWSGIAAGLIHLAYTESGASDTLYRTVNTESADALSTQTVIFAGTSAVVTGSHISIARARGGNVYCRTTIDAGAEGGFFRLPNANVPNGAWDAARTINEALATQDQSFLAPGFAADTQDMMLIFVDASANGLSRQVYDDSANSWAETAIVADASFVEQAASASFPHVAVATDLTNSRLLVVAWNAVDAANQDLLGWTVTEGAITAFATTPVLNATDDCGLCAISIDTASDVWTVFYGGKSDGSETFLTSINIYRKGSRDAGATWGPETKVTILPTDISWLVGCPRQTRYGPVVAYNMDIALDELNINVDHSLPRAVAMVGF